MHTRELGALRVGAVGLGTLPLAGGYGAVGRADAIAAVRGALDLGMTLIDTADFYGGGEVEELVGRALAGRRSEAVIATRGGAVLRGAARPTEFDGSPAFLREACDASLRRLGTDHIDLYTLARPDPRVPIEESTGALADLVTAGKVRHIGLSEVPGDTLRRAHRVHPVAALQSEYSLWERGHEAHALAAARALGVGFVAHTPLGRGFLTGAIASADGLGPADYRRRQPRFAPEALARDTRLLAAARPHAHRLGITLGQLALAWLLTREPGLVPIPGSRDGGHLAENAAAADRRLPDETMAALDGLFAQDPISEPGPDTSAAVRPTERSEHARA